MKNKKILIITYYWPPSGGSGVQRWLKFVKYLTRQGWEPYVYTPENPSFTIQDESLSKDIPASVEVIKLPIWEPYRIFFGLQRFMGKKSVQQSDLIVSGKKSFYQKVISWVRGNFFIPDARIFWVKPSVRFLIDFIQTNEINRIITTGPPHSMHLIGLSLKKKLPSVQWIADFRDPWSEWDLLDTLSLTSWARNQHKKLERDVLCRADKVVTIASFHVARLEALSNRKVDLITNGFDTEDFEKIERIRNEKFVIRHIGVVDELRDPRPVLEALKSLVSEKNLIGKMTIEFIGNVNSAFKEYVFSDVKLNQLVSFKDNVPHSELLAIYGQTDLQLLVLAHTSIAPGNLPGKFFEYLASGNPILAIGPIAGDAAQVLKETDAGIIHDRNDREGIKSSIFKFFNDWQHRTQNQNHDVSRYTRENLTNQLIKLL